MTLVWWLKKLASKNKTNVILLHAALSILLPEGGRVNSCRLHAGSKHEIFPSFMYISRGEKYINMQLWDYFLR